MWPHGKIIGYYDKQSYEQIKALTEKWLLSEKGSDAPAVT